MYEMWFERITFSSTGTEQTSRELVYRSGVSSDKYRITAPKFSQGLGLAGELTFTMYPNDNLWQSSESVDFTTEKRYTKITTYVYLYNNGKCFWRGRVIDDDLAFNGQKIVHCEGQLALMNNVSAQQYSYGYGEGVAFHGDIRHSPTVLDPQTVFERFIAMYNEHMTPHEKVHVGNTKFKNPGVGLRIQSDEFNSVLEEMINVFGGEGYFDCRYVDTLDTNRQPYDTVVYVDFKQYDDMNVKSNQAIRFGENMLDLNNTVDASNIYTVILPLGNYTTDYTCSHCGAVINVFNDRVKNSVLWTHLLTHGTNVTQGYSSPNDEIIQNSFQNSEQGKRLTISSVYIVNGIPFCTYPEPGQLKNDTLMRTYGYIERVVIFEDIDDPSDLLRAAIAERNLINMIDTLTVTAFDLNNAGYNIDSIELGDMVQVYSSVHGVYRWMQCNQIDLDLEDPTNNVYHFGAQLTGITDSQISTKKQADKNMKLLSHLSYKIGSIM